jgi:hypothetical protein
LKVPAEVNFRQTDEPSGRETLNVPLAGVVVLVTVWVAPVPLSHFTISFALIVTIPGFQLEVPTAFTVAAMVPVQAVEMTVEFADEDGEPPPPPPQAEMSMMIGNRTMLAARTGIGCLFIFPLLVLYEKSAIFVYRCQGAEQERPGKVPGPIRSQAIFCSSHAAWGFAIGGGAASR